MIENNLLTAPLPPHSHNKANTPLLFKLELVQIWTAQRNDWNQEQQRHFEDTLASNERKRLPLPAWYPAEARPALLLSEKEHPRTQRYSKFPLGQEK